jgi:phosphomannomutase / phosphoglucomutase
MGAGRATSGGRPGSILRRQTRRRRGGVRVVTEDGTWGLVRASSNKPELVVVVESPVSEARMREMFKSVDAVLRTHPEVGAYNQTI